MSEFTDEELIRLVEGGESDRIEFKEALTGSAAGKIREAICAFANDLPGHRKPGIVFVGVRDDGTAAGLSITDQLLRQLADMKTDGNILPPPSMTVEKRALQGKDIAVIAVEPSNSPPVRCKGAIHIRIGTRHGIATAQDEKILSEKRRHGDQPFDIQPIPATGLSDLNLHQFENEYLVQAFSDEILAANSRAIEERLSATKMILAADPAGLVATVLGILVIGKNPQDFLPGAYVQFLRIDGSEYSDNIIDSEEISGAVPDILRRLDEKLKAHNHTAVEFTNSDIERRNEIYPLEALQQIVRNAVMHRRYDGTNTPVRVSWYNDRIEVLSPGGLFGIGKENFGQPGFTDYRNPNLAEAMRTLGYVQRFGMGILIARKKLADAGHPEPEFETEPPNNFVLVTIWAKQEPGRAKP